MIYRIDFQFLTPPVIGRHGLMLDALLASVQARRMGVYRNPLHFAQPDKIEIPVAIHADGYALATRLCWDEHATSEVSTWTKTPRFGKHADLVNLGKVMVTKGKYKAYQVPIETVGITSAWAWLETDAPSEVESLLGEVESLGKKGACGHGLLNGFSMIEDPSFDFFANIMRPIPVRLLDIGAYAQVRREIRSWKAPYWDSHYVEDCVICGNRCA